MPSSKLTTDQVIEFVKQLPFDAKLTLFWQLNAERQAWLEGLLKHGEQHLRQVCAERGRNWDALSEEEREMFVSDYLDEED